MGLKLFSTNPKIFGISCFKILSKGSLTGFLAIKLTTPKIVIISKIWVGKKRIKNEIVFLLAIIRLISSMLSFLFDIYSLSQIKKDF